MNGDERLAWSAPEYEHRHRGVDWFWGLGLLVLFGAGAAVYLGNALFAIILVLAGVILAFYAVRPPQEIEYELSSKGVRVEETFYPYSSLESYWVTERSGSGKIILISKHVLVMHIIIPIVGHRSEDVRAFLDLHLPAVEHEEPWIYVLAERLGF